METYTNLFTDRAMERLYYDNMKINADYFVRLAVNLNSKLLHKNNVCMHIDFDDDKEIYTLHYFNIKTKVQSRCDFYYAYDMKAHIKYMMVFDCVL